MVQHQTVCKWIKIAYVLVVFFKNQNITYTDVNELIKLCRNRNEWKLYFKSKPHNNRYLISSIASQIGIRSIHINPIRIYHIVYSECHISYDLTENQKGDALPNCIYPKIHRNDFNI